jgi:hypothetical protein
VARVTDPVVVRSQHYPQRLEYLVVPGVKLPEYSRSQERVFIALGSFAWRLNQARKRKSAASTLAKRLRDVILKRFPATYGIRVYNRRSVQIRISTADQTSPKNVAAFIAYLGVHAPNVITGFQLPLETLLSDPSNYQRFARAMLNEFGEEIANEIGVSYNRERMWDLINTGKLKAPPVNMFRTEPSDQRRVLVDRIENHGPATREE